jgi:hypothetical protein
MPKLEDNPIHQAFEVARITIREMLRYKTPPGLMLCGPAGLGKTHIVRELTRDHLAQEVVPFRGSVRGLIEYLFENRDGFMLFDDFDKVFYSPDLVEILKIVLDSNEPRILVHRVLGANALPPFEITATVVFCSNLNLDDPSKFSRGHYQNYIKPLKSRLSMSILTLPFLPAAIFEYTMSLASKILGGVERYDASTKTMRRLSLSQQKEIIDHFTDNVLNYPEHTPRIIRNLGLRRLGIPNDPDWQLVRRVMLNQLTREKEAEEREKEEWKESGEDLAAPSPLLPRLQLPPHLKGR